jgi:hypothetical protein
LREFGALEEIIRPRLLFASDAPELIIEKCRTVRNTPGIGDAQS